MVKCKMWNHSLSWWNKVMFFVHLILAIVLYIWFERSNNNASDVDNMDLRLYKTTLDIQKTSQTESIAQYFLVKEIDVDRKKVQKLILAFFLITAFFHFYYWTDAFGSGAYSKAIAQGNNYFRWIEYSITATIMVAIMSFMCGIKETNTFILLLVASVAVMYQGQPVEVFLGQRNRGSTVAPTASGWILMMGIFYVLYKTFGQRLDEVKKAGYSLPSWLPFVLYPMLVWFASFGVVQLYQIMKLPNYQDVEKIYLILSLLSKAFLGVYLAYGFSQRNDSKTTIKVM